MTAGGEEIFFWKTRLSAVETHSHAGQTPPHCPLDRQVDPIASSSGGRGGSPLQMTDLASITGEGDMSILGFPPAWLQA